VQARNDQVIEGLRSAYAAKVPGGSLAVFCVSNETYKKSTRKGNLEMIKASGIPALRSFCHSITAQAQLVSSKHFLKSQLGSLLNSLRILVDSCQEYAAGLVPSGKSAEDYLDEIEAEVLKLFSSYLYEVLIDIRFRAYFSTPGTKLVRPSKRNCSLILVSEDTIFLI
jgi:hypothetical protein